MYEVSPTIWLEIGSFIVVLLVLFISFSVVMSKWLKVERKKFFSSNYVNEKHKKVDGRVRVSFIVVILFYIAMTPILFELGWTVLPWVLPFILIAVTEGVRAFMEWKYADNPRAYILTLSELGFLILVVWLVVVTDFLGVGSW